MRIVNPIYDVVFRHLMENNEIAKLIISTITGEEIVALDFLPQEGSFRTGERSFTVYRLDFSAKIKKTDGSAQQVVIEIQKAKFAADIMRFRRYLGSQYQKKDNTFVTMEGGEEVKKALPIISIYFLGYRLDHATAPVIKVARKYYDITTGEEIREREEFIESLTHDSYIIQIPYLRPDCKTDVERLLGVFDQRRVTSGGHLLDIDEQRYPEKYRKIIRLLERAIFDENMQQIMDAEDEIIEELGQLERRVARKEKALEEMSKEMNKALEEALDEKYKALEEKDKVLEEKDKIIQELRTRLA